MTLKIKDLIVKTKEKTILGPFSLTQEAPFTLAIMGPSGSGKTTLAKCIAGFDEQQISGEIHFNDQCLQQDQHIFLSPHKRRFVFIAQHATPWPHLNAHNALALTKYFSAHNEHSYSINDIARLFGLSDFLYRRPDELSGGQKQRLLIAQAFISQPKMLIFDEALFALDLTAKMEIINLIKDLKERFRFSLIFITHDLFEAWTIADNFLILSPGNPHWHGPKNQLKESPLLKTLKPQKEYFLGVMQSFFDEPLAF